MSFIRTTLVLFLSVLAVCHAVPLWGNDGHRIVAYVAQNLLSPDILSEISNLLSGQSLADVASWADEVKRQSGYGWSATLHYVNTPDWACTYERSRDCADEQCVTGAITNYTQRLSSTYTQAERNEALKFLTHFIGDVHQPMHVSFTSDRGGNSITGHFEGSRANLHAVWDSNLLLKRMKDFSSADVNYASYLVKQIGGAWSTQAKQWATCSGMECSDEWATESVDLACSNAYLNVDGSHIASGFDLGDDYYNHNVDVVDMQLARGGVRLAAVLQKALAASISDMAVQSETDLPSNN